MPNMILENGIGNSPVFFVNLQTNSFEMKIRNYLVLLLGVGLSIMMLSCRPSTGEKIHELIINDSLSIQNGDLLFVGLPLDYHIVDTASMDEAISAATGQENEVNFIHVAILEVDENDSLWIIDATIKHGVDRHPFSVFVSDFTLNDGSSPEMVVMRLQDNANVNKYVENAKTYCGREYDMHFLPDNEEQYCSELVRNSYTTSTGAYIFSESPMNFKSADGTFPPYWVELFDLLGEPIPQGVMGTNPNEMSQEQCLKRVGQLTINNEQ